MKKKKIKELGQHFLKNPFVVRKIISCISPEVRDLIIEIGAGKGALTSGLAEKAGKVVAVEMDETLIPHLASKNIPNLKILKEDVLKIDFASLVRKEQRNEKRVKVVGNLPYSISSPLLFKLLSEKECFSESVFLLQKEVAERICANPGSKKYAPLSLLFENFFSRKLCFFVSPSSFSPPPQVESALIALKKRETPLFPLDDMESFSRFLKGTFKHRRKILANNLLAMGYGVQSLENLFRDLKLSRNTRAEQLSLAQFFEMYNIFRKEKGRQQK